MCLFLLQDPLSLLLLHVCHVFPSSRLLKLQGPDSLSSAMWRRSSSFTSELLTLVYHPGNVNRKKKIEKPEACFDISPVPLSLLKLPKSHKGQAEASGDGERPLHVSCEMCQLQACLPKSLTGLCRKSHDVRDPRMI